MKYYLFKEKKGLALYRTTSSKTSRYLDFYPTPLSEEVELIIFDNMEQAQAEIEMLDNHFGEYGWEAKIYEQGKSS